MKVEFTKEWINSISKIINDNKCWIPLKKASGNGYIQVTENGIKYQLHRIVLCVYYNKEYQDQSWESRHNKNCDLRCFFIDHLKPGTHTDNMKDLEASREFCPKCSERYSKRKKRDKYGILVLRHYCRSCERLYNLARKSKRNE
jgi:hypothetical protein